MTEESKPNGQPLRLIEIESMADNGNPQHEEDTLLSVLHRLFSSVFFPDPSTSAPHSLIQRLRVALSENGPSLKEASRNSTTKLLRWTRRGSPFRALFVISVGTITFLSLTGLLVFMLFFLAATANAVIISLLMSLAAAGGFLALFFTCMTGIYIAALSVALFVISTATVSAIIAVIVATGWIGFLWTLWLAAKTSVDVTRHSLSMTGSALSAYSAARHARHRGPEKVVD
ncbi:hypothetical protein AAC387_Pa03g1563 [Persea americana]